MWTPIFGEVEFYGIADTDTFYYPVQVLTIDEDGNEDTASFAEDGRYMDSFPDGECLLFPSRENRNWSTFQVPKSEPNNQPKQTKL